MSGCAMMACEGTGFDYLMEECIERSGEFGKTVLASWFGRRPTSGGALSNWVKDVLES